MYFLYKDGCKENEAPDFHLFTPYKMEDDWTVGGSVSVKRSSPIEAKPDNFLNLDSNFPTQNSFDYHTRFEGDSVDELVQDYKDKLDAFMSNTQALGHTNSPTHMIARFSIFTTNNLRNFPEKQSAFEKCVVGEYGRDDFVNMLISGGMNTHDFYHHDYKVSKEEIEQVRSGIVKSLESHGVTVNEPRTKIITPSIPRTG
jgi:hypothetical protein